MWMKGERKLQKRNDRCDSEEVLGALQTNEAGEANQNATEKRFRLSESNRCDVWLCSQNKQRRISRECHLFLVLLASWHSCGCSLNTLYPPKGGHTQLMSVVGINTSKSCYGTKTVGSVGSRFSGNCESPKLPHASQKRRALRRQDCELILMKEDFSGREDRTGF